MVKQVGQAWTCDFTWVIWMMSALCFPNSVVCFRVMYHFPSAVTIKRSWKHEWRVSKAQCHSRA